MELKPGYKQTEVGLIPEDWNIELVRTAYEIRNNLRLPLSENIRKGMQGGYPYYGPTKIQDYINEYRVEGEYCLIGEDGDHFLKWKEVPMTLLARGKFNVNNQAHLVCGIKNETLWFFYYFNNRDITKHLTRQGAGRYKLTKASLQNIPLAIPPTKTEQTAIANVLSDTDALIQSLTRLIAKKRQIKQGAMQTLLNPYENGRLKEGWEEKKLGEIGVFRGGCGFPTRYQGKTDGLYPFYKVSDMNNEGNEKLMINANNWIDEKVKKEIGVTTFPKNTIIFAKIGAAIFLERKKILNQESCIDNNLMGYVFDTNLYSVEYLHYLFQTIPLGKLVSTTALPSLNGKEISAQKYYFPNKLDQTRIATILSGMDAEIAALEAKLEKYRQIKQGMMQNLLTGRIRLI